MKWLLSFFKRSKAQNNVPVRNGIITVRNKSDYADLSNIDAVWMACKEYSSRTHQGHFTSAIIYKFMDGLLPLDKIYKNIYKLNKKERLKKVTIISSVDSPKHVEFYKINQDV